MFRGGGNIYVGGSAVLEISFRAGRARYLRVDRPLGLPTNINFPLRFLMRITSSGGGSERERKLRFQAPIG
eukprot:1510227-Pyramimonas_sp.AAC.1